MQFAKTLLFQMSDFQDVFHGLRTAVLTRSKQMSLGLGLCVFVLTLGVGAMMLATIKRHQLLIESVVYSSIGSLKRIKNKSNALEKEKKPVIEIRPESQISGPSERESNSEITTTTKVDFFPRYSVVNKSQRGVPRHLKEKKIIETNQVTNKENNPNTVETKEERKRKSYANSVYDIFSTLKFKSTKKPQTSPEKVSEKEEKKAKTSFYYQYNSSDGSNYDLTLGKTCTQVQAQVHHSKYGPTDTQVNVEQENELSSSPQPLLQEEKIYSFRTLQEKCRKMIAGSKPFQDSTRL